MPRHLLHSSSGILLPGSLLIALVAAPAVAGNPPALPVTCDRAQNRLTFAVDGVPLQTLLAAIAERCGLDVRADPGINPLIAARADRLPIDAAIDLAVARLNVVRGYREEKNGRRLSSLVVLPAGTVDVTRALPVSRPVGHGDKDRSRVTGQDAQKRQKKVERMTARMEARLQKIPESERAAERARLEHRIQRLQEREKTKGPDAGTATEVPGKKAAAPQPATQ